MRSKSSIASAIASALFAVNVSPSESAFAEVSKLRALKYHDRSKGKGKLGKNYLKSGSIYQAKNYPNGLNRTQENTRRLNQINSGHLAIST